MLCIKQPLTVLYRVISCLFPPALSTGLRKYFFPVPIHRSVPAAREIPAGVRHSLYLFTWKGVTFFHDEVSHITKTYRVARRDAGFRHAFRSLFRREYEVIRALDDVSFTIEDGEW